MTEPPQCVPRGLGSGAQIQRPDHPPCEAGAEQQCEGRHQEQGDEDQGRGEDAGSGTPDRPVRVDAVHGVHCPAEDAQVTPSRPQGSRPADEYQRPCRRRLFGHLPQGAAQQSARLGRDGLCQAVDDLGLGRGHGETEDREDHQQQREQGQNRVVGQRGGPVRHVVVPDGHRCPAQCRPPSSRIDRLPVVHGADAPPSGDHSPALAITRGSGFPLHGATPRRGLPRHAQPLPLGECPSPVVLIFSLASRHHPDLFWIAYLAAIRGYR